MENWRKYLNQLAESTVQGEIKTSSFDGAVKFWKALFPDNIPGGPKIKTEIPEWLLKLHPKRIPGVPAQRIYTDVLPNVYPSVPDEYGPSYLKPAKPPRTELKPQWVKSSEANSPGARWVHEQGLKAWRDLGTNGQVRHLRQVLPDGRKIKKKVLVDEFIKNFNEAFLQLQRHSFTNVPLKDGGVMQSKPEDAWDWRAAKVDKKFTTLSKRITRGLAGAISVAKPLPGEGELSLITKEDAKEAIKSAVDPNSKGWMVKLSKTLQRIGGPVLSVSAIATMWDDCEGEAEEKILCMILNSMSLVPIKVEKRKDILDINPTGRFDHLIDP